MTKFQQGHSGILPPPGFWVPFEAEEVELKSVGVAALICCPNGHFTTLCEDAVGEGAHLTCKRAGCDFDDDVVLAAK